MANINNTLLSLEEIDQMIIDLSSFYTKKEKNYFNFTDDMINRLCISAIKVLKIEDSLVTLQSPICVVGNVHGQFKDLLNIFKVCGNPCEKRFLFLGDYVDRGRQSLETITLLLLFKIRYPENITLLRGNHESSNVNSIYGFYDECQKRVSIKAWRLLCQTFLYFPYSALINNKIFCLHGGLSPNLKVISQINNIKLPSEIPEEGIACDLVWSDPSNELSEDFGINDRGVSFTFSSKYTKKFNQENGIDLIIRAHQVIEEGYEFFAEQQLVTIFSVPNYLGYLDNQGAIIMIDENLLCSFSILKRKPKNFHVLSDKDKRNIKLL